MSTLVVGWDRISPVLEKVDLLAEIEQGFVAYSRGECTVPPVGEMLFDDPPGEVHIKYGALNRGDVYVVKIASGFSGNPALGVENTQGVMLLFDQRTGQTAAVLLDEGKLTDVRTAAAGAVAFRALAPKEPQAIGVLGTGTQALLQLDWLRRVTPCRRVRAWGRTPAHVDRLLEDLRALGFEASAAESPEEVARSCRCIVTTTPSRWPLLYGRWLQPGTHITAMGSDSIGKQELDADVMGRADRVVVDSLSQCRERGELAPALAKKAVSDEDVVELGAVLGGTAAGRGSEAEITVVDLTGVAVQDLAIARAVWKGLSDDES